MWSYRQSVSKTIGEKGWKKENTNNNSLLCKLKDIDSSIFLIFEHYNNNEYESIDRNYYWNTGSGATCRVVTQFEKYRNCYRLRSEKDVRNVYFIV